MKKTLFLLAAALMAIPLSGQEKPQSAAPADSKICQLKLAAELADYGYKNSSALALLQAADILSAIPASQMKDYALEHDGEEGGEKTSVREFSFDRILADAREMAGKDKTLLDLAKRIRKSTTRGAVGGPYSKTDRVLSHGTDRYTITFRAGEEASVLVNGDGDTDLDLYIYDQNGNLIDSDTDYTDTCLCSWTPKWTGPFTVKIVNRGSVYNNYTIWTN